MTRMSKRAIRPGFDDLERRGLLSGLLVGGANAAVIVQPPVTPPLALSGTITGNYNSAFNTYELIGNGPITITPPGGNPVTLSAEGSISLPTWFISLPVPGHDGGRFILPNHGGGTLTLSDSQGTLTLQLTGRFFDVPGPFQLDFPFLPDRFDRFDFEITGGTGAFANATGGGTASLQLVADPNLVGQTGRFDLDLEGPFSPVPPRDEP
jgi:hypothetical protein